MIVVAAWHPADNHKLGHNLPRELGCRRFKSSHPDHPSLLYMVQKALLTSEKHCWQTPVEVFVPLHQEFSFTIDAAASDTNALLPRYWTREQNAILQDWSGERVWCNPPYGVEQKRFVLKAAEGRADISVLLLPARPDTAIWQDTILPHAEIRFIRGRIRFVGAPHCAPFPSAVVIFKSSGSPIHQSFFPYKPTIKRPGGFLY